MRADPRRAGFDHRPADRPARHVAAGSRRAGAAAARVPAGRRARAAGVGVPRARGRTRPGASLRARRAPGCTAIRNCCAACCRTSSPMPCATPRTAASCSACAALATRCGSKCTTPARASRRRSSRDLRGIPPRRRRGRGRGSAWAWRSPTASRSCSDAPLTLRSRPGAGTMFAVTLPRVAHGRGDADRRAGEARGLAGTRVLRGRQRAAGAGTRCAVARRLGLSSQRRRRRRLARSGADATRDRPICGCSTTTSTTATPVSRWRAPWRALRRAADADPQRRRRRRRASRRARSGLAAAGETARSRWR